MYNYHNDNNKRHEKAKNTMNENMMIDITIVSKCDNRSEEKFKINLILKNKINK